MSTLVTFDSKAITASGNSSGVIDLLPMRMEPGRIGLQYLSVLINVTAATGTSPSLTVEVQWSNDGTNFVSASTPDAFTAITAAGAALKTFQVKAKYARLKYTVSGTTPSLTADISGLAV